MSLHTGKIVLSPMVRAGTLTLRLLSIDYGADLVYSEEIVDRKLIGTERCYNAKFNTIDYVSKLDNVVVFRTCEAERGRVILQIGTSDPERALAAAKLVESDVAGIDVNMGCPKHFSTSGGMGANLLRTPELAQSIVRSLSTGLNIPVSCKIRCFPTTEETIRFARAMQEAGASAIALHCREPHHLPTDPAGWTPLAAVARALSVPLLANGDAFGPAEARQIRGISGASGLLVGRAAMWNPSIFRPIKEAWHAAQEQGPVDPSITLAAPFTPPDRRRPVRRGSDIAPCDWERTILGADAGAVVVPRDQVMREYVQKAIDTGALFQNVKYVLMQMLIATRDLDGHPIAKSKSFDDLARILGLEDYLASASPERSRLATGGAPAAPAPPVPAGFTGTESAHKYSDEYFAAKQAAAGEDPEPAPKRPHISE